MELPSMTQIDFDRKLFHLLRESETWAREIIIKENQDFMGIDSLNPQALIDVIESIKQIDNPKEYPEFQEKEKLLVAYSILIALNNFPPDNISEALFIIYLMGHAKGYLDAFKPGRMHLELWERFCHKKVSKAGQEERWEPIKEERQQKLAKIEHIANERYSMGYRKPHHDLAEHLKKDPRFSEISKKVILKVVGRVAEQYDCKTGVPKKTIR
jgi:hypothetical protein